MQDNSKSFYQTRTIAHTIIAVPTEQAELAFLGSSFGPKKLELGSSDPTAPKIEKKFKGFSLLSIVFQANGLV